MPVPVYNLAWHMNHAEYSQDSQTSHATRAQNAAAATQKEFEDDTRLTLSEQVERMKESEHDGVNDREKGSHSYFLGKRGESRRPRDEDLLFESDLGQLIDLFI